MTRTLQPGQRCEVWIASATGGRELVYTSEDLLLEAPNWTPDAGTLVLNGDGKLWTLDVAGRSLAQVPLTGIPDLNNDHVLDPGGGHIFLSASDGHIYRAALGGGQAARLTRDDGSSHFLHGVSPDGRELAYVGIEGHCDGPEYSPDGGWLYFNTEAFTSRPGHAQLARVRAAGASDGGTAASPERLLESDTVDWFPHLSPDGSLASYIRFPSGTEGHPADLPVDVVLVSTDDWATPLHTWPLFGGQGTLNVNSWAPDSARFAYVAYPF